MSFANRIVLKRGAVGIASIKRRRSARSAAPPRAVASRTAKSSTARRTGQEQTPHVDGLRISRPRRILRRARREFDLGEQRQANAARKRIADEREYLRRERRSERPEVATRAHARTGNPPYRASVAVECAPYNQVSTKRSAAAWRAKCSALGTRAAQRSREGATPQLAANV